MMGTSITDIVSALRQSTTPPHKAMEQAILALAQVGDLWEHRLNADWEPPTGSPYPWAQVRLSLAGLIPGLKNAREWLEHSHPPAPIPRVRERGGRTAALILAGNTPLMSWSPLCACLLAGYSVVVKMSRDETLWPRLFVESLAEVDLETAARISLQVWPGEDARTNDLVQSVDAVIAFGSDSTIEALRRQAPNEIPFFGYGHSVSVSVVWNDGEVLRGEQAKGIARDVLMYGQQGCLSPHILYGVGFRGIDTKVYAVRTLPERFAEVVEGLGIEPVADPAVARRIREVRDLAAFSGLQVVGDERLRWTILYRMLGRPEPPAPLPIPVGHGVLYVSHINSVEELTELLTPYRGTISAVGGISTASTITETLRQIGISYICDAGEMQIPPLDWPNGNFDLLAELLKTYA